MRGPNSKDAPRVVLLHGASGTGLSWSPVLDALSAMQPAIEAVAPDLPGRGTTPGPALESVYDLAEWLDDWLAAADIEAPILVGHSLGGAIALTYALQNPDAISGLVLVASSARLRVAPTILHAVKQHTPDAPFRLDFGFGPRAEPAAVEAYVEATRTLDATTAVADWTACDGFDIRDELRPLKSPVLVLHGDADVLTPPRHQVGLANALGGARRALVGIGHMLPWEAPEILATAIRDLTRSINRQRRRPR